MHLLLKQGRVIDPSRSLDDLLDVRIAGNQIAEIGRNLKAGGDQELDATDLIIAPGFVDIHVHLREPGKEEAETIQTGTRAAAAGGFTAVGCMPNTNPPNDNVATTQFILTKANNAAGIPVYPIAAVTIGQQGTELTNFEELKNAGAVAFSDDGKPVFDSLLMRRALESGKKWNFTVIDHCEDPYLFKGGAMNEGPLATRLGIRGIPAEAEEIIVARNISLAKLTRGTVHLAHLSTAGSMDLVRRAKADGISVTSEVTPHHFTLTEDAVAQYGTNAKMNPPLRSQKDVEAILEAISDGTVDAIASDHAPHAVNTKTVEFHEASFGIIGLETSVSLGLDRLVHAGLINLNRFIELYSLNPARILSFARGIQVGAEANLTLFHPYKQWTVDASKFLSKSRNTPFDGRTLKGCPMLTICRGEIVFIQRQDAKAPRNFSKS
jgi:dihydroorotase